MNPNENRKNQFTLVKDAWAPFVSDSMIFKINSTWCGGYHALQILAQPPRQCVLVERNIP